MKIDMVYRNVNVTVDLSCNTPIIEIGGQDVTALIDDDYVISMEMIAKERIEEDQRNDALVCKYLGGAR